MGRGSERRYKRHTSYMTNELQRLVMMRNGKIVMVGKGKKWRNYEIGESKRCNRWERKERGEKKWESSREEKA